MRVEARAYARAGLLGNPSDGYFGKTIAITVKNFSARVWMADSPDLKICSAEEDLEIYQGREEFLKKINLYGYHGGLPLIKATIKVFFDYCRAHGLSRENNNFVLWYESSIPRQVGLGGSSALVVATLRALMKFFNVSIPLELQPTLALRAEKEELGITAGFMDRVVQVYEGCVYMDLDRQVIEERGFGTYERLDANLLPPLYLAYRKDLSKVSGRVLSDIQAAYESRDPLTVATINRLAEIAAEGREAFFNGDFSRWPSLMDENFDRRAQIMKVGLENLEMVQAARRCGASAKFAGSGGSIIGIYKGEEMFERLLFELGERLQATVLRPTSE